MEDADFRFYFDGISWTMPENVRAVGPDLYTSVYNIGHLSSDMFTEDEQRQIQAIVCAVVLREYGKAAEGLAQYGIELDDPGLGKETNE